MEEKLHGTARHAHLYTLNIRSIWVSLLTILMSAAAAHTTRFILISRYYNQTPSGEFIHFVARCDAGVITRHRDVLHRVLLH